MSEQLKTFLSYLTHNVMWLKHKIYIVPIQDPTEGILTWTNMAAGVTEPPIHTLLAVEAIRKI